MIKTKVIGRLPQNYGDFDPHKQGGYGKKQRCFLFACEWESKMEGNTYAPATLDTTTGVITPDTAHWKHCSGSYNDWLIDNGYKKVDAGNVKDGNSTQHEINAALAQGIADETLRAQNAENDRYTKSEVYTKAEVNGLITTPDQGFVSVEATSSTTSVNDVLPATGDPDTIYRVGNWDGSQYDASCYTEYAWSSEDISYIKLSTKQVGIDDTPTAGSDNLVKSGGVKEWVKNIKDSTNKCSQTVEYAGKVINAQGEVVDNSTYNCSIMFVIKAGATYIKHELTFLAYYDVNGNFIGRPSLYDDTPFTTPDNAVYARVVSNIPITSWQLNEGTTLLPFEAPATGIYPYTDKTLSKENVPADGKAVEGALNDIQENIAEKGIALVSLASSKDSSQVTAVGQYYFNTATSKIYRCTEYTGNLSTSVFEEVPFVDGAVYTCNEKLYVWNGTSFVEVMRKDRLDALKNNLIAHSYPAPIAADGHTIINAKNKGNTYWHSDFVVVRNGMSVVNLQALEDAGNIYIWFYDKYFNLVSTVVAESSGVVDSYALSNAPADAVYFRFNYNVNSYNSYISPYSDFVKKDDYVDISGIVTENQIVQNSGDVETLKTLIKQAENLFDSAIIGVKKGDAFIIQGFGGSVARLFTVSDKDGRIVSISKPNYTTAGTEVYIAEDGILSVNFKRDTPYKLLQLKNNSYLEARQRVKTDITSTLEPMGVKNAGDVGGTIDGTLYNSNFLHAAINVKTGDAFMLTATAGSALRTFALLDSNGVIVDIGTANIAEKNRYIYVCQDGTLTINADPTADYVLYKYVKLNNPEDFINPVYDKKTDAFVENSILNNSYKKVFKVGYSGGNAKYFTIPNNGDEQLDIHIATTTTGFPLLVTLYYESGEERTIYYPQSFCGDVTIPAELTSKLDRFLVYFGSSATSGSMTVEVAIKPSKLPVLADLSYKKKYQFGRTCDFKYESELINVPEHTFRTGDSIIPSQPHTVGAVVNVFYDLYDALVSQYPQYVTKVDCDALALAEGIDKSDYPYMAGLNTYMYKFIAPNTRTPDAATTHVSLHKPKLMIVSGTHAEYEGMYDVIHMMQKICNDWASDRNLEELRWNADIYVIPCSAAWTDDNDERCPKEYEGGVPVRCLRADPNRNAPSYDWIYTDPESQAVINSSTWSGNEPGDLYESKVFKLMYDSIMPDVFIDRHNAYLPTHDSNGMIYIACHQPMVWDCCNELISYMTRSWRTRYAYDNMPTNPTEEEDKQIYIFPSMETDYTTMLGTIYGGTEHGMREKYAAERGALGLTAESLIGTVYYHGQLGDATHNYDQKNTRLSYTCGMEALVNLCCRLLALVSYCDTK